MGVKTFAQNIPDAAERKAARIAELQESIQKNEEAVPKFKAINDKYFNSFWKMKSDLNNLSNEENPSSEVNIRMKELDETIVRLEEVFKVNKPEENIRKLEESIKAQKAELQRLNELTRPAGITPSI